MRLRGWRGVLPRASTAGKLTAAARDALIARVAVVPGPDAMGKAGLVIEAVIERLDVKAALFRALEASVAPEAVLATNTSSLSVASVAAGLAHPARVLGLHFFNPAPAMRLVELIAPPGTDPRASALARQVCEGAGKVVIDAPDRPGFIVNRCARPYYGEALALLAEGRAAGEIDAAMVAAGYRLGPFSLIDLIGADINLAATEGLAAAMGGHPRYHVFAALRAQVARGDLGRKTGKGFVFPDALPPPPAGCGSDRSADRGHAGERGRVASGRGRHDARGDRHGDEAWPELSTRAVRGACASWDGADSR